MEQKINEEKKSLLQKQLEDVTKKDIPTVFSYVAEKRRDGHRYISFPKEEPLDIEWIDTVAKIVKKAKLKSSDKMVGIVLGIPKN
jgi:hypothetical protein